MDSPVAIIGVAALVALAFIAFVALRLRKRKLSGSAKRQLLAQWNALGSIQDAARRVLEADSILDKALGASGFQGSLGEKLKQAGPRFSDFNAVWTAHKLRNRIAHEPGSQISEQESSRAIAALRRAFEDLC